MITQSSLDPRITPWKRGDVCTRNLDRVGFVLNCTREYLEVRRSEGLIALIPVRPMRPKPSFHRCL
jgi:hypothetical protein